MNEEEAIILVEVLDALYSDYPYAVCVWAVKQARTGYDWGWVVMLSHDERDSAETLPTRGAVLEHIQKEVAL